MDLQKPKPAIFMSVKRGERYFVEIMRSGDSRKKVNTYSKKNKTLLAGFKTILTY